MSLFLVVGGSGLFLLLAYFTYGRFLARKVFRLDDSRITPAVELNDGLDYVPAKKGMLLGQHFSAIAAAGPINGPILAGVLFGWAPALIWILIGSVLIGGVHDMGSLIASIRHEARSITEVIRTHVSRRAWALFMVFIWITLVYIIVAFTDITAGSFIGTVTLESGEKVGGGAIAASSVLYLILPVLMGLLLKFTRLRERWALLIFLPLVGVAIWAGKYMPIDFPAWLAADPAAAQKIWCVLILVYCVVASVCPVWLVLQPRGAIGGCFLYAALIAAAIGVVFGGCPIEYPAFTKLADGLNAGFWFPMFPLLFITVACGACSGFHSLVSSGTTCKQIKKESDVTPIGYGAMLLEGMVAVVSLACVMIVAKDSPLASKAPNFIYASGIGRFLELIGISASFGISFGLMAFTTFVYDTLDVCTRLGRYIFEELTGLRNWFGRLTGTILTAGVPLFFIFRTVLDGRGNPVPAWKTFWTLFGASNQLLAALALIGVSVWLMNTRRNSKVWLVSFLPAVFMFVISDWSLIQTATAKQAGGVVPIVAVVLIVLSAWIAVETGLAMFFRKSRNCVVIRG
ncbi:MAG: carbon starvation protein A [Kiritimatiellaceae bacterium]|nr:carbon starvation protein A [Kiritimatiellaceae bacterium]